MEVNEKKQMLQAILQKLFVGLIFCFGIIGFNMTAGKVSAQAAILKNYDFKVVSEVPLHIEFWAYDDKKDGAPQSYDWNEEGRGEIKCDPAYIDKEDGTNKYVYLIHMRDVNVSNWTPWLSITAANTKNYTPYDFTRTGTQDYGLTGATDDSKPHYSGDVEKNSDGYLQTYLGMAFNDYRLDAKIGYTLNVNYNGATTHPDQTAFKSFFTKFNPRSGTDGEIPNLNKTIGTVTRKGYTLDGWYCGSQKLFDKDGNPARGAHVNGLPWSDSDKNHNPPLYMWYEGSTITAHWTPKKYRLTLNYNNADKFPDDWGKKQATGVYYQDNFLKYDHYIGNAFGPGKVSRTGYTFNGWWLCNSSGKVAQLWDANGKLIKGRSFKVDGATYTWSDGSGNYKCDGNTYVIADWVKNAATNYNLTLNYSGIDSTGKTLSTSGLTMPSGEYDGKTWKPYFTHGEKIKGVFGSGSVKRTGYTFGGWFCGSKMLWDSNGNVQKDVWIDGKQWSDKSGNYVWNGHTTVWAKWFPKPNYALTLVYNGADHRGGTDGEVAFYNNYFKDDKKGPGRSLPGVYGKGTVKKTGYYFKGWYCGDVMLWDENGEPKKNAIYGGKQWSSGGRYMWDGSTTVTAHWEPMKTSLKLDWGGATEFYHPRGFPTTWYPDFYAYNDKTHDIYGESQFAKLGYDFMGWYHGDTKVYDTDGTVVQNVWVDGQQMDKNQLFKWIDPKRKDNKDAASDGITLTARWNPKIYGINLDDNGGSGGSGIVYEKYQNGFYFDYKCTSKTSKVKVPSRTGYTFTGYWYGAEQIIDEYGNIKATSSRFTENVTAYAGWSAKVFKITLDNQGADKRSGTSAIYERYADGFFLEKECVNRIGAITTPKMTGYSFYGYYADRYDIDADWSDGSKQIINENGVIGVSSTRFTSDTTIYAYWVDDIGPEEDSTYLTVTKTDDKDYVYAKATKSSVSPVSLRLSCTPGTLPQITWNTDINEDKDDPKDCMRHRPS